MATIKIQYRLSEVGQKASLLAGGDGCVEQSVTIEATAETLALASVTSKGEASLVCNRDIWGNSAGNGYDGPQTAESLIADEIARRAAATAQRTEDERVREVRRQQDQQEARDRQAAFAALPMEKRIRKTHTHKWEPAAAWDWRTLPAYVEAQAECDWRNTEEAAKKEAAALAEAAERRAWILAHGGERLKKALALDLLEESDAVYRDERLALERPGWEWDDDGEDDVIRNPSLEALTALEAARESDPDVVLQYLVVVDDEDGYRYRGPVLSSTFLDRLIRRRLAGSK